MTQEQIKADIEAKERIVERQLKDFQLDTVRRVAQQFRSGHNRILVADEVGLGKTMVAKGVIVAMARIRMLEEGDDNFKIIYVCSNQNIANQNIDTIDVFKCGSSQIGSRLSEVHFGLAMKKAYPKKDTFVEMIPLTPSTSFRIAAGQGTMWERALMFVIIKRIPGIGIPENILAEFLRHGVNEYYWEGAVSYYDTEVGKLSEVEGLDYPNSIINEILTNHAGKIERLRRYLLVGDLPDSPSRMIGLLRTMFAEISVGELNPDLVIMDEFQRFKFLIDSSNPEANIISRKFLTNAYSEDVDKRQRVLLLSATPYKLYSTFEEREMSIDHVDEHYTEFLNVMHFLEDGCSDSKHFDSVWKDYSRKLHLIHKNGIDFANTADAKEKAEELMYQFMCRTERLSVMHSEDYIDDSSKNSHITASEYDIKAYTEFTSLLKELKIDKSIPVDYVKSCPYLMSFMHDYEAKRTLTSFFRKHPDKIDLISKKESLWINKNFVRNYKVLPVSNSRLEPLFRHCFSGNAALFLWIPPAFPYYRLSGVYQDAEDLHYSKILLFSAWEMVPRMIACLTSYEAERRTVAELCRKKSKAAIYDVDTKKRYPAQRLTIRMRKDDKGEEQPATMALLTLMYPSKVLGSVYSPVDYLNDGIRTLEELESSLRRKIQDLMSPLVSRFGNQSGPGDAWYYLTPFLLDYLEDKDYVLNWIAEEKRRTIGDDAKETAYAKHLSAIESRISAIDDLQLGKLPADLVDTLVDITLGGFATCIHRRLSSLGSVANDSTRLAKRFIDRFNTTESVAIVELSAGNGDSENSHWEDMLKYSKNGCFQSMFDEYFGLVYGSQGQDLQKAIDKIENDLDLGTVSNKVEGYHDYKRAVQKAGREDDSKSSMRCHFAMGFSQGSSVDEKSVKSKDNIRHAFNSPLRPFVLASTSIGQEGLDFHQYCRKIMHWNLPSNPIDFEQREGRINRYKCLVIRQNIAHDYGTSIRFAGDVWDDMFSAALNDKKAEEPDLIPFWCYNKPGGLKIERILPLYPLSSDVSKYERLIKILSSYRLTLGQARQEELLEYVFQNFSDLSDLNELFFDLSPFSKAKKEKPNL